MSQDNQSLIEKLRAVLDAELAALGGLRDRIGPEFASACEAISAAEGKLVATGVGSSLIAARKFAFNLRSAGVDAAAMSAEELMHGGIGLLGAGDIFFVFSYSGEALAPIRLAPAVKKSGAVIMAATGYGRSSLARIADTTLEVGASAEGDPLGALPTASFMALTALADAVAAGIMCLRNTTAAELAARHPGSRLGHGVDITVEDILRTRAANPVVSQEATFKEALVEMTSRGMGAISVIDAHGGLVGILTDGDVRRLTNKFQGNIARLFLSEVSALMIRDPKRINAAATVNDAVQQMERNAITVLPVVDPEGRPVGMIHLHDLVKIGFGIQAGEAP